MATWKQIPVVRDFRSHFVKKVTWRSFVCFIEKNHLVLVYVSNTILRNPSSQAGHISQFVLCWKKRRAFRSLLVVSGGKIEYFLFSVQWQEIKNFCLDHHEMYIIVFLNHKYVLRCAIWYHSYNFKNVKNTHGGVLLLQQLNFTKSNTPPWVFYTFLKLHKWYQITQSITYAYWIHQ